MCSVKSGTLFPTILLIFVVAARGVAIWNWSVIGIIEPGVAEMNLPSTATQLNYVAENSFEEVTFRYLFTREWGTHCVPGRS